MQKRIVAILLFSLLESILCYNVPRIVDPFTITFEQFLSDLTFEIVPHPNYPNDCLAYQSMPYPTNPYFQDGTSQCGRYPEYFNLCDAQEYPKPFAPRPNILDIPCRIDPPACSCYRDISEPCIIFENPAPLYICFEGFEDTGPAPYMYFPQVEYPMTAMDIKPYYYGSCWCT